MFRLRYFLKHPTLVIAKIGHHNCVQMFSLFECINVPMVSLPMNLDCKMVDVDLRETWLLSGTFVRVEMFLNLVTARKEEEKKIETNLNFEKNEIKNKKLLQLLPYR